MSTRGFQVTYAQLGAMRLLTSDDESRICLNGIHVEIRNDEVNLIAACGRRMGIYNVGVSYGGDCEFTIPNHLIDAVTDTRDSLRETLMVHYEGNEIRISNSRLVLSAPELSATGAAPFPGWRKVIGEANSAATPTPQIILNSEFLGSFIQAAKLLDSDVRFVAHGELEPLEVFMGREPSFYGLLMPIRETVSGDIPGRPGWLLKLLATQPEPSKGNS